MIHNGLAHWHTLTAALRARAARELSRWTRGTLVAVIGFGTFLMLLGGLFTWVLAREGFRSVERGVLVREPNSELIGFWAMVLVLLFGGDSIRSAGWRELCRRRRGAAASAPTGASASHISIAVGLLLAPVLLFWGAMGLMSFLRLAQMLSRRSVSTWLPDLADLNALSAISLWSLLTLAWLAGGVILIWRGINAIYERQSSDS